jgi:uncharacterized membrane protein
MKGENMFYEWFWASLGVVAALIVAMIVLAIIAGLFLVAFAFVIAKTEDWNRAKQVRRAHSAPRRRVTNITSSFKD